MTLSAGAPEPFSFRDIVEHKRPSPTPLRKGERTRVRIKLATIDLLNKIGYHDVKISDICEAATITPPVFYIYFASKRELTEEVLREFLDYYLARPSPPPSAGQTVFEGIYLANLDWLKLARVNGGIIRCLLQYSDEEPEFAKLFSDANQDWYQRITRSILRRFPAAGDNELEVLLAIHALGGMIDDLARRLFADKDPQLSIVVEGVAPTDVQLAYFISRLWMRMLYLTDPADTQVGGLAALGARS